MTTEWSTDFTSAAIAVSPHSRLPPVPSEPVARDALRRSPSEAHAPPARTSRRSVIGFQKSPGTSHPCLLHPSEPSQPPIPYSLTHAVLVAGDGIEPPLQPYEDCQTTRPGHPLTIERLSDRAIEQHLSADRLSHNHSITRLPNHQSLWWGPRESNPVLLGFNQAQCRTCSSPTFDFGLGIDDCGFRAGAYATLSRNHQPPFFSAPFRTAPAPCPQSQIRNLQSAIELAAPTGVAPVFSTVTGWQLHSFALGATGREIGLIGPMV
jgi:hypothetical protein